MPIAESVRAEQAIDFLAASADFYPQRGLRGPALQSFLASFRGRNLRTRMVGGRRLEAASRDHFITVDDGEGGKARLHCLISRQPESISSRGQVVLIHGWEGCAYSVYLFSLATTLYLAGFDVVRLHLRDHGGTHHLNAGIFHAGRLHETVAAVRQLADLAPQGRQALIGFSLGGNFTLRVAAAAESTQLSQAVAVCPVIDTALSFQGLLDAPGFYQRYFRKKMMRSLRAKQQCYPSLFNFDWVDESVDLTAIFEYFAEHLTPYGDLDGYFSQYAVHEDALHDAHPNILVVAAADDPVVPTVPAMREWRPSSTFNWEFSASGGHCGYINDWMGRSWIDRHLLEGPLAALD